MNKYLKEVSSMFMKNEKKLEIIYYLMGDLTPGKYALTVALV